jgi:hypothetical protein
MHTISEDLSNEVRLSPREWVVAALAIAAMACIVPVLWPGVETVASRSDTRIPYGLGNDYWAYDRHCRQAASQDRILLLGDSVIWGHYVAADQTLSHYLNGLAGGDRFANMAVDGIHPAALAGLVEYHGRSISGRNVILHCNLLWMSSPRHDLQEQKEFSFNHPSLVPQFFPRIPCYRQAFSRRVSIILERYLPFLGWVNHLQVAYFEDMDVHNWTIRHPYSSPLSRIWRRPPLADLPVPPPEAQPWTSKDLPKLDPEWVDLERSFQWQQFTRTIDILERRGNRVFVLLGPFNEHMLEKEGLETYARIKSDAQRRLRKRGILCLAARLLPSECYADASHPLSSGYAALAREMIQDRAFATFSGLNPARLAAR